MKNDKNRLLILAVAKSLFNKYGFEKTSMDEIARQAHKAKRSLYNYYANKESLFCASVKSEIDYITSQLQPLFEDNTLPILEQLKLYLLKRTELISLAGTYQLILPKNMSENLSFRFEELNQILIAFDQWEHAHFAKVWEVKSQMAEREDIAMQSNSFADMLQMAIKALDYSFFVDGKYEQCKESYCFLINLIINSINSNLNI